jgi:hypothetical protein
MSDERTPADLRREVLRARREREEAIRKELELPPEFDDDEEDSKVTLTGPAAEEFVRARSGLLAKAQNSFAPISKRMDSRGGRIAAAVTGGGAVLVAAVRFIVWLAENGFLG